MKKLFALLFAALLACCCVSALGEGALTVDEVTGLWDALLAQALSQEPVEPEDAGEGLYSYEFDQITLVSADAELSEASRVQYAEFRGGIESLTDGRGIGPGSTLRELLAAYPLDNQSLNGTYEEAVLYISGMLPDLVSTGRIQRSGSHVLQAEYTVIVPDGQEAEQCFIGYTLENNVVTSVYTGVYREALAEAERELDALSSLQEARGYSAYSAGEPEPLAREDLLFTGPGGAIDFISAGENELRAVLGEPQADNWEQEQDVYFRTLEWDGVTAVLAYDAQKEKSVLMGVQVYGEQLEGPRGLHMGDTMDSVTARFPQAEEGQGREAEGTYGVLVTSGEEPYIEYTVSVEEAVIALDLDFVDDALFVITCVFQ